MLEQIHHKGHYFAVFVLCSTESNDFFLMLDVPGGTIDDPGGGFAFGSSSALAISTPTPPKPSASFVSSSLTTGISSLSLSGKSTVYVDYATGSFCSSLGLQRHTRALRAGVAMVECMRLIIGEVGMRERERERGGD